MGDRFAEIEIPEVGSFHDMIEAINQHLR